MKAPVEQYGVIGNDDRSFDVAFWQDQGAEAIFQAALELVLMAEWLREGHADEPRLQRTVEEFGAL